MKTTTIRFKRPVGILQVFSNIVYYGKEEKSFADRQQQLAWQPVSSVHGGVVEGHLYLPEALVGHPRFFQCDLITIVDDSLAAPHYQRDLESHACLVLDVPRPFAVFNLVQRETLELHLRYDHFYVGIPERQNFKICDLQAGEPVEVKVNGKTDFSLTGRRARLFKEQQYIFNYLGLYEEARLLKAPVTPVLKTVPAERKLIDLLKPLW